MRIVECYICASNGLQSYACSCSSNTCVTCESKLDKCPFCRKDFPNTFERMARFPFYKKIYISEALKAEKKLYEDCEKKYRVFMLSFYDRYFLSRILLDMEIKQYHIFMNMMVRDFIYTCNIKLFYYLMHYHPDPEQIEEICMSFQPEQSDAPKNCAQSKRSLQNRRQRKVNEAKQRSNRNRNYRYAMFR